MNATTIAVIVTGTVTIIGALVAGIISIITTVNGTRNVVLAGQEVSQARGKVRDNKIQEIHLLVNSRLLTVLKLVVIVTKKEADRTGSKEDQDVYLAALRELENAQASANTVSLIQIQNKSDDEEKADIAEKKLADLSSRNIH